MLQVNYDSKADVQYIDTRDKEIFQQGHLTGALNLNPTNFETYGPSLLDSKLPLVLILETEDQELYKEYQEISEKETLSLIEGYILTSQIPSEKIQKMEAIAAEDFMQKEGDYILLDVRTSEEITRLAPEKNLKSIPLQELSERYSELDAKLPIYTLCGSGTRATAAGSFLEGKGYQPIVITGGMKAVEDFRNN